MLAAEPGNLNRDATPDWVVVLNKPDEKRTSDVSAHPTKRPLLLFVGDAGGRYTPAARSDNAVYCVDCGGMMGDPFQGITVKNGYFTVEHYGGSAQRWTRLVTFRYDPAARCCACCPARPPRSTRRRPTACPTSMPPRPTGT